MGTVHPLVQPPQDIDHQPCDRPWCRAFFEDEAVHASTLRHATTDIHVTILQFDSEQPVIELNTLLGNTIFTLDEATNLARILLQLAHDADPQIKAYA